MDIVLLTMDDYFLDPMTGRDRRKLYPHDLSAAICENAGRVVQKANEILAAFGEYRRCNSGWRPPQINAMIPGAAPKSNHMRGLAIDLEDRDRRLTKFCVAHAEELDFWMETPNATPTWCHIQVVPPKSGKRVYIPFPGAVSKRRPL